MRIGITDTLKEDNYNLYIQWIRSVEKSVEIQKLSYRIDRNVEIKKLDGLLLTGGGDVLPQYYGKESFSKTLRGVNQERDEFEFSIIEQALDEELPILGVCRGMQVMNVFLGGSLIMDLMSEGYQDHTSPSNEQVTHHPVSVMPHSLLNVLTGTIEVEVNSFHHQGIDQPGKGLMSTAVSQDNVIEAAEWALKDTMPFLMLVQWHPERMKDSFLSQKLAGLFLREVSQKQSNKRIIKQ